MDVRDKDEIDMKSIIDEQMQAHPDEKVRLIYERYQAGKTIILDDLKYLWIKDPEGCKRITKSIIEAKAKQRKDTGIKTVIEAEANEEESISIVTNETQVLDEKVNTSEDTSIEDISIEDTSIEDTSLNTTVNIHDIMSSMKLMLEQMNNNELLEMWNHMNEVLIVEKMGDKLKHWDNAYGEKIMMKFHEIEKKFNILA